MLDVGAVVEARIERIETYGAYLRCGDEPIFVDHAFYSWEPGGNPLSEKTIGDAVPVRILGYAYKTRITCGSFKHVDPDANPYRHLSRLAPDTVFDGQVGRVGPQGALVLLSSDVRGWIPASIIKQRPVHYGEQVQVRIRELDVDDGRLTVEPVELLANDGVPP